MAKSRNPNVGLGLWGPLVPANDCKPCLATLATVQAVAGTLLCLRSFRRGSLTRNVWSNRLLKVGGLVTGSVLVFSSGLEFARLTLLEFDPWIIDAQTARRRDLELNRIMIDTKPNWRELLDLKQLKYWWFGPSDYVPCSWEEWKRRSLEHIEKATAFYEREDMKREALAVKNRAIASEVYQKIEDGTLKGPHFTLNLSDPTWEDLNLTDDEFYDNIDMRNADLWTLCQKSHPFSVALIPYLTLDLLVPKPEPGVHNIKFTPTPRALSKRV